MKTKIAAFAALGLLAAQSHAAPTLNIYTYAGRQVGNSSVSAGLIVSSGTYALGTLTVAGGWTVSCPHTSQINLERTGGSTNYIPGLHNTATVYVPETVPSTRTLPGWSNIPTASCVDCTFAYKGSAVEASASISVGSGVNFTLPPAAQASLTDQTVFQFCRGGTPQCCTDGCYIP